MAKFTSKSTNKEIAIFARSDGVALHAETTSKDFEAGISGVALDPGGNAPGLYGQARGTGPGVFAENNDKGRGGFFRSAHEEAVYGETKSVNKAAIAGFQNNPTSTGAAIYAEHIAGLTAGFFKGNVIVTGDLSFPGADCAEDFTISAGVHAEPGTVMVLGDDGELVPCHAPYDRRVAGVLAGAGSFRPGIVMDRQERADGRRQAVALVGKVFCQADASFGAIATGDLMTTSATEGHAMKAGDPTRAFGAVIGKAMAPLDEGRALIPILIALQ